MKTEIVNNIANEVSINYDTIKIYILHTKRLMKYY